MDHGQWVPVDVPANPLEWKTVVVYVDGREVWRCTGEEWDRGARPDLSQYLTQPATQYRVEQRGTARETPTFQHEEFTMRAREDRDHD